MARAAAPVATVLLADPCGSRMLLGWIRAQGATAVGVKGLSLGGYTTALLTTLA